MDMTETSYTTGEVQGGTLYVYGLGFFFCFFILIIFFYVSYICKHHIPPPPVTTNTNHADQNHHFQRLSRGLDDDVLVTFPTFAYSELTVPRKVEGVDSTDAVGSGCYICLAEYKQVDTVRLLPECGHLFHVKCIDTWLKVHPTCPVCRKSLLL